MCVQIEKFYNLKYQLEFMQVFDTPNISKSQRRKCPLMELI